MKYLLLLILLTSCGPKVLKIDPKNYIGNCYTNNIFIIRVIEFNLRGNLKLIISKNHYNVEKYQEVYPDYLIRNRYVPFICPKDLQ